MKVAIISDIHSNLEALERVLADIKIRGIKHILCAGDIIGYGANPDECVALLRKNLVTSTRGNHDDQVIKMDNLDWFNDEAKAALIWTNKKINDSTRDYLSKLPLTKKVGHIFIVHGSPFDPLYAYIFEHDNLEKYAKAINMPIIITGHTHKPFIRNHGKTLFINPGSVGQPRDNNPKTSYCVLDTDTKKADIIRLVYDIELADRKIRKASLPLSLADRLHKGI